VTASSRWTTSTRPPGNGLDDPMSYLRRLHRSETYSRLVSTWEAGQHRRHSRQLSFLLAVSDRFFSTVMRWLATAGS